jgi:hypothetical protein
MEAQCSTETSILTRATQRNIPEDGILHSYRRENLKSYKVFYGIPVSPVECQYRMLQDTFPSVIHYHPIIRQ